MIFDRAVAPMRNQTGHEYITVSDPAGWNTGGTQLAGKQSMKLSAVNRCVACRTESMGKLPVHIFDTRERKKLDNHPLAYLLGIRPNEAMTPTVFKQVVENNRLLGGNGYAIIYRNPYDAQARELIPVSPANMRPYIDDSGKLWYVYTHPRTGEMRKLNPFDVLHYKAYTEDGITGISVLQHASNVIATAGMAQHYEKKFYSEHARPSGVLSVEANLDKEAREKVRSEWERIHSGVDNAFRVAVLDLGIKYQQIGMNNKDAQFVESKEVTVVDIARFFGVPLYKLYAGKQAYNSNEQNGIEYVVETLHPTVTQYEEEDSYKLLFGRELRGNLWIRRNMMAELKGDVSSRAQWYKAMREMGAYSVNRILELEDEPDVPGGDTHYASLNYIPLELFEELSIARNKGEKTR